MRLWYVSHRRPAKAQASLRIRAVLPEPFLFAHMKDGSRRRVRPKIRHLPHYLAAHARLKNEFTEDEKCHNLMSRLISPTCMADRAGSGQSGCRPKNTAFDRDFTVDGTIVIACYRVDTSVDYGCHRVDTAVDRQRLLKV